MKRLITFILVLSCVSVQAQVNGNTKKQGLLRFFRMKQPLPGLRLIKTSPRLATLASDYSSTAVSYWQGATFTRYSENGRLTSTHTFDVQGMLRESRTSFSIRKRGILSNWSVQISPQRSRPFFVYRIQ